MSFSTLHQPVFACLGWQKAAAWLPQAKPTPGLAGDRNSPHCVSRGYKSREICE